MNSTMVTGAQQPNSRPPSGRRRFIWICLILIIAVIVGASAGLLVFATGAHIALAVLAGGGAFAGSVKLLLDLMNFWFGKST
jgi:hypothetical protein